MIPTEDLGTMATPSVLYIEHAGIVLTINVHFVSRIWYPMFAVMSIPRRVHEVDDGGVIFIGGHRESEEVLIQAHPLKDVGKTEDVLGLAKG